MAKNLHACLDFAYERMYANKREERFFARFKELKPCRGKERGRRMSSYGKNVLSGRDHERTTKILASSPAGKRQMPKQNEANIDEIWPLDSIHRQPFNERNRGLDTKDINRNFYNVRQAKLRNQDQMKIESFLKSKEKVVEPGFKPYKNASSFNPATDL